MAAASMGACWGGDVVDLEDEAPAPAVVISNPIHGAASASPAAGSAGFPTAADEVVYVSLASDSFPAGRFVTLRNPRAGTTVSDSMVNGGLDAVPVAASKGDTVTVEVFGSAGLVAQFEVPVPETRKPRVVRVSPTRKKRDVPLNARPVIFFTEPVAPNTVTPSSVQLLRGDNPVAGTVRLLEGTGAMAAFVPAGALTANTEYRLLVTQDVRDLAGETLEAPYTASFTTGQGLTGPPARIRLSPDTVVITGLIYQMTAMVEDSDGNLLIDQPITWVTTDPEGLAVSATGRLYALEDGSYTVFARVGDLEASAFVRVQATPASVTVLPQSAVVTASDTVILTATVRDTDGRLLQRAVTWSSSNATVATVAPVASDNTTAGVVTGVNPGTATITARSGPASGTASVTVSTFTPAATLKVAPGVTDLLLGDTLPLSATARDAADRLILRRPVWTSDNPAVATVDATGVVKGVAVGSAVVVAALDGMSDTARITVTAALSFTAIATGGAHTCALTALGTAYCWGRNHLGQAGDGTTIDRLTPVRVSGTVRVTAVSPGGVHTCGVTADQSAYCWGPNWLGLLGTGSDIGPEICGTDIPCSRRPVAVVGGLRWRGLQGGLKHTCGLTTDGIAYCWGYDGHVGALGDGSTSGTWRTSPAPVAGGHTFAALSTGGAGFAHTCALTSQGAAYCWGSNHDRTTDGGQLGDGTNTDRSVPVPVKDTLKFVTLSTGMVHTCGLTAAGAAYCWGVNNSGQLGDGTTTHRLTPVAVLESIVFSSLAGGSSHTCGLTAAGAAYCWGYNRYGGLGDGTTTNRLTPVQVAGGLSFTVLSAGGSHTCGLTATGVAYCWGEGEWGRLGSGTTTNSSLPVKVAGQP
jgi:alpha-tubulin suppressor-like RCC1 family protein